MSELRIADDLALPLDFVTQTSAILARRGAGKTYAARKIAEQVIEARQPIVILDPLGAFWGLRSSADGKRAGLPVVILGGEHGDLPLEPTAGKVIADVVVDHPGAYVIDLSGFESKGAEQRFATDFLERLYRAKATKRDALLLVVDEADVFAPQRPGNDQARLLGAMEAIVRRGRIRGLGVLLISQRAAVMNKNVLTQTEVLVAMQTTGPQDRDAIDEWIKGNGTPDERAAVLGSLASLERGEAWLWSPSWLRRLVRIRIARTETFDSSATPEAGQSAIEPTTFAKVDLAKLGEEIAATIEQQAANDPAKLKKRIRELEIQVDRQAKAIPSPRDDSGRVAELERQLQLAGEAIVAMRAERDRAATSRDTAVKALEDFAGDLAELEMRVRDGHAQLQKRAFDDDQASSNARLAPTTTRRKEGRAMGAGSAPAAQSRAMPRGTEAPTTTTSEVSVGETRLGKPHLAILAALSQYPRPLTQTQLAFLADYHPRSKGFTNALGTLRSAGLITPGFPAALTDAGRAHPVIESLPPVLDPRSVFEARLGGPGKRILDRLVAIYPLEDTREDLAAAAGYEHVRSKGFTNAVGQLRGLGLVVKDGLAIHPDFAHLLGIG